ncbi:MAG: hypothetical protein M1820_003420 [Bogoriella megaspora]|nr:MAG: hypothetical protein M1820_003420 [Bogoriella megaspora]
MRIAIAGTGGLAFWIAHYIQQETPHQVLLLSRTASAASNGRNFPTQVVNYGDSDSLRFALAGADIVVSTVLGQAQIQLIEAAVRARVRRFVPAEFEGSPRLRPAGDPLDRGRLAARQLLYQYRNRIQSTSFICGIFYERFQPGGLAGSRIGSTSGFNSEGDYILDLRNMTAQVPLYNSSGQYATICMTAVQDVARFVVRALEIPEWPPELSMCGDRMTVFDLVSMAQNLKGESFEPIQWHVNAQSLQSTLNLAVATQDIYRQRRTQALIATAEERYNFATPATLNRTFSDIQPTRFRDWLVRVWNLDDDDDDDE